MGFLKDGRLTITGREKDTIIIYGENYYSHDIEVVVEEVEGVEVSYTAAYAVREPGDNTDRLAVFFSATDTEYFSLNVLMQKFGTTLSKGLE